MKRRALVIFAFAAAFVCLAALFAARPFGGGEPAVSENFRLGTYVRLSLYDFRGADDELKAADDYIRSLENLFSVNIPASDVARLNASRGEWTEISAETAALIEKSLALARFTDGAFDPAMGGLTSLWKIGTQEARVPSDAEIAEALKHIDFTKIELRCEGGEFFARLPLGMALDLGAVAKGYIADLLKARLASDGVRRAMLDLGGNLDFIGDSPRGGPWRAGLQRPDRPRGEYFGIVEASDVSVVTSGPYERYFEKDGVRYHHILDPATGRPARSGLSSVTVIDADSARADALCTALFVMGAERAPEFLARRGDIKAVLLTEDGRALVTPSAKNIFRLTDEALSLSFIGERR